jgi:transcriptional regulator with XRE-family HTH domain
MMMDPSTGPVILRASNGAPVHAVLGWADYQALLRAAAAGDATPALPDEIRSRLAAGTAPLRAWRELSGLSQASLARQVGISRAYLTQIEAGERTGTVEVMARLARALGCRIEQLLRDGEDEKLDGLARMPGRVAALAALVAPNVRALRPAGDSFSLVEHVCHLRDIDAEGYGARLARMLAEEAPELPDIDGAALAQARCYQLQDFDTAFADFTDTRRAIVARLRSLTAAQRLRTGRLEGVGDITIDGLIDTMAAHDAEHLDELAALPQALARTPI